MLKTIESHCQKVFKKTQRELNQARMQVRFPYNNSHQSELEDKLPKLNLAQKKIEKFVSNLEANIEIGEWPMDFPTPPYYRGEGPDYIRMPYHRCFYDLNDYYSHLFHELGHWTGHESRFNRPALLKTYDFTTTERMFEEILAVMTSSCLCDWFGIKPGNRNSDFLAVYLQKAGNPELSDQLEDTQEIVNYLLEKGKATTIKKTRTAKK